MIYVTHIDKTAYTIEIHEPECTTILERRKFESETQQDFEKRVHDEILFYIQKLNN